jgi:hypothetical protein
MTKYEFIQVNLELIATHTVMGTQQPLWRLPMARSARGTTDFAPFRRSVGRGWMLGTC